jgi:cystathionine beta-lyase
LWLDISAVGSSAEVARFLREKTGLFITAGTVYGRSGEGFLRMNIACPKMLLKDGLERFSAGIRAYLHR